MNRLLNEHINGPINEPIKSIPCPTVIWEYELDRETHCTYGEPLACTVILLFSWN